MPMPMPQPRSKAKAKANARRSMVGSTAQNLCAMMAWCFQAPSTDFDLDGDLRMTREQQRQHQNRHRPRLPWFLGGPLSERERQSESEREQGRAFDWDKEKEKENAAFLLPFPFPSDDASFPAQPVAIPLPTRQALVPPNALPPRWVHDERVTHCHDPACGHAFDLLTRKHHCRACGRVFCAACTGHTARVVKYGFTDPVRVCRACALEARVENDLYQVHLPLLERGQTFVKRGLFSKRLVDVRFVRTTRIFQYRTMDPELRLPVGELQAFPLDGIVDVRPTDGSGIASDKTTAGFSIAVGSEEHRFEAASVQQRHEWMTAIRCLQDVQHARARRDQEREAEQQAAEEQELREVAASAQRDEERKAACVQERLRKRAEQRDALRAKYKLGGNGTGRGVTAAS